MIRPQQPCHGMSPDTYNLLPRHIRCTAIESGPQFHLTLIFTCSRSRQAVDSRACTYPKQNRIGAPSFGPWATRFATDDLAFRVRWERFEARFDEIGRERTMPVGIAYNISSEGLFTGPESSEPIDYAKGPFKGLPQTA
ncbi:hypothetical protein GWI33_013286 [Rhynchophorus ferrugineus]|uniref:Uncharacterized protein n=1 Tax=Rhynchophorus ferrugineus TaxID=354439 RepID=A0A834I4X1_RHYFE|nr:hypothetical protein GWI33_013286 [Rhynchophorus ferrugineus]